jgi:hypothetical protein
MPSVCYVFDEPSACCVFDEPPAAGLKLFEKSFPQTPFKNFYPHISPLTLGYFNVIFV